MSALPTPATSHRRVALLVAALLLSACGSDPVVTEPQVSPISRWAGSYTGQARFGAANGTWGNGGTFRLVISNDGQVTIRGALLQSPVYDPSASTLSWRRADGNDTNGEVTLRASFTSDFFFRDLPNATAGQNLTGYIQRAGEGKLDYRGVLQ